MSIILQDDGLNGWFWLGFGALIDAWLVAFLAQDTSGAPLDPKLLTWANIVECDFDGYVQQEFNLQSFTDAASGTSDIRTITLMPVTFSGGGVTPNFVKYWGILSLVERNLVCIEPLTPEYLMNGAGNSITITPSFLFSSP